MSLLDSIKTALKKVGLKEDLAEALVKKVTKEEEIEGIVTELKKKMDEELTDEEFLDALKKAGLEDNLRKYAERHGDKRVTEAIKTHDEKMKAQAESERQKAAEEEARKKKEENMSETDKRFAALERTIQEQKSVIDGLQKTGTKEGIKAKVEAALKEAKIDPSFSSFINVESLEAVPGAVTELVQRVEADRQSVIDSKLKELGVPESGLKNKTGSALGEKAISDYAEMKNKGSQSDQTVKGKQVLPVDNP